MDRNIWSTRSMETEREDERETETDADQDQSCLLRKERFGLWSTNTKQGRPPARISDNKSISSAAAMHAL